MTFREDTAILIPARMESKRLPGKPLIDMHGKTLIRRVVEACQETKYPVFVLTDDMDIAMQAVDIGASVIMEQNIPTDKPRNGTERCAQAVKYSPHLRGYKHFVNVQGDMIDIHDTMIEEVIAEIGNEFEGGSVITAYEHADDETLKDPNVVKAIVGENFLHWCGRGFTYGWRHLGIYAYTRHALIAYLDWPMDDFEEIEGLEQLRWLAHDFRIRAVKVHYDGIEINTQEDVDHWLELNSYRNYEGEQNAGG